MGKVMSLVTRKAKRFNVESRAHKLLERDKPVAAPKFESNIKDMQRSLELDPQLVDKLNRKDKALDDRLKSVYVTSEDSYIDYSARRKDDPDRPLPLDRRSPEYFEYGYQEPIKITHGRCTLRQALQFINDHQNDPNLWTAKKIGDDYKLKENQVEKILTYFKTFSIHLPDLKTKDSLLTQSKKKMLTSKDDEFTSR